MGLLWCCFLLLMSRACILTLYACLPAASKEFYEAITHRTGLKRQACLCTKNIFVFHKCSFLVIKLSEMHFFFFKLVLEKKKERKKSAATWNLLPLHRTVQRLTCIVQTTLSLQPLARSGQRIFKDIWDLKAAADLVLMYKWFKRSLSSICCYGRQAGGREGRLDGDFTDTNNFLTQRYCNSGGENSSPFHPMNQHDPISA